MKRAVILGKRGEDIEEDVLQFYGIMRRLRDIYDGVFELDTILYPDSLTLERLMQYELVISYTDCWKGEDKKYGATVLACYVASGGNFLAIHGGLIFHELFELSNLTGAKYIRRSTPCLLDFVKSESNHVVSEGMQDFHTTEEAYFFALDHFLNPEVLAEMQYAGRLFPAAWCHRYGWGKVVCVTAGRQFESFQAPLQKLLYRSGLWFLNRI